MAKFIRDVLGKCGERELGKDMDTINSLLVHWERHGRDAALAPLIVAKEIRIAGLQQPGEKGGGPLGGNFEMPAG